MVRSGVENSDVKVVQCLVVLHVEKHENPVDLSHAKIQCISNSAIIMISNVVLSRFSLVLYVHSSSLVG